MTQNVVFKSYADNQNQEEVDERRTTEQLAEEILSRAHSAPRGQRVLFGIFLKFTKFSVGCGVLEKIAPQARKFVDPCVFYTIFLRFSRFLKIYEKNFSKFWVN